jgi:hypothetical protein
LNITETKIQPFIAIYALAVSNTFSIVTMNITLVTKILPAVTRLHEKPCYKLFEEESLDSLMSYIPQGVRAI